jgi:hypothetical protein
VSCNATGARPDGVFDTEPSLLIDAQAAWYHRWLAGSIPGWTQPENYIGYNASHESRVLSDEGRMFFDSPDALVPQATNGREDVYEYEPVGVGGTSGCTTATRTYVASEGGCVSLISAGTSSEESAFLDASESGNDVFILTAARLVARDVDSAYDVYDAHVCSAASPCVSVPVVPPPCTSGDACKAAPSPQPAIFGAPSSATFSGAGNITPEPPPVAKTRGKGTRKVGCPPGKKRSHGRCVKARKNPKPVKAKPKTVKAKKTDRRGGR